MPVCGICKENKDVKNKWIVREHTVDNAVLRDFKLCDGCAVDVVRKVAKDADPEKKTPAQVVLTRAGFVDTIALGEDGALEVTLSMDLARARKIFLDHTEERK